LPIAEHGLIGDLHTVALVGTDGTIDWYCGPRFELPSIFAAILDADRRFTGHGRVAPRVRSVSHAGWANDRTARFSLRISPPRRAGPTGASKAGASACTGGYTGGSVMNVLLLYAAQHVLEWRTGWITPVWAEVRWVVELSLNFQSSPMRVRGVSTVPGFGTWSR
jgi:hypothetical protein